MVPTTSGTPLTATEMAGFLYGTSGIPASFVGLPVVLNDYATVDGATSTMTDMAQPPFGWRNLFAHVEEYDAADYVGQCIIDHKYKPLCGFITTQPDCPIFSASKLNNKVEVDIGGCLYGMSQLDLTANGAGLSISKTSCGVRVGDSMDEQDNETNPLTYDKTIEKSQWLTNPLESVLFPH
jgi:hypothetical protein